MFGIKSVAIHPDLCVLLLQIEAICFFAVLMYLIFASWKNRVSCYGQVKNKGALCFFSLALTALLSFLFFDQWGSNFLILAIEFGIGIVLSLFHPAHAICFFITNQILRPWNFLDNNDMMLAMPRALGYVTVGSWILHDLLRYKTVQVAWNKTLVWLGLFVAWLFASTLKTPDVGYSQAVLFDTVVRGVIIFVFIINMVREEWELEAIKFSLFVSIITIGISAVVYFVHQPETATGGHDRLSGFGIMGNANDLGALMVAVLPIPLVRLLRRKFEFPLLRVIWFCFLLFTLWVIYWSKSRGAVLALLVILATVVVTHLKKRKHVFLFLGLLTLSFFPLTALLNRDANDVAESSFSRTLFWKTAAIMAVKNPLLGVGFGEFPSNFHQYTPEVPLQWGLMTAHSSWFLVLGEASFLGLFFFLMMFVSVIFGVVQTRNKQIEVFLVFMGYLTAMTFLSHCYLIFPYLILGIVVVSIRISRQNSNSVVNNS